MKFSRRLMIGTAGIVLTGLVATTAGLARDGAAPDTAPEARYVMDVGTIGGFMGQGDQHELTLRLGSRLPASGTPAADHFMPEGARLGRSVPLVSPEKANGGYVDPQNWQGQRPKGRLLIYWGCGERAGPGQPVVIDFARLGKGQVPPNLFSGRVPMESGPQTDNSRTYGEWPNGRQGRSITPQSSLIGQHRVAGNYSPEIAFALNQDFMAGLRVRSAPANRGATALSWNGIREATGYYAWAMGAKDMGRGGEAGGDMVWWASSATQEFGGGLWSWLSPATVNRLIGQKIVMPPSQTSCTIPAEVRQAAGEMLMSYVYAYGPEANFAWPERPADPKLAWNPKWTAKVRYRSMGQTMVGMPEMPAMGGMSRGNDDEGTQDEARAPERKPKPCKPKLGGLLGSALTGGRAC